MKTGAIGPVGIIRIVLGNGTRGAAEMTCIA
jgi:hypothetical protein